MHALGGKEESHDGGNKQRRFLAATTNHRIFTFSERLRSCQKRCIRAWTIFGRMDVYQRRSGVSSHSSALMCALLHSCIVIFVFLEQLPSKEVNMYI